MKGVSLAVALMLVLSAGSIQSQDAGQPFMLVLGTAQDGGYPHIGCMKPCCRLAWSDDRRRQYVVSLALVDPAAKQWWLFEATPDIREQLQLFRALTDSAYRYLPDGIFVTHAHIGHYAGLMQLGREAMHAREVPVFVLPRLKQFLEKNGPWSQLVGLRNIVPTVMTAGKPVDIQDGSSVTPFLVPHRDEYSETAGFEIIAGGKNYLFIPDIDKWSKFERDIVAMVQRADAAFLDATFFSADELSGRSMDEIPHPLVSETTSLFKNERPEVRRRMVFIHLNHTNPLLWDAEAKARLRQEGYEIGFQGMRK